MNTAKLATALNTISVAFGELAEALNESPDPVRSGGSEAGTVARPAPTAYTVTSREPDGSFTATFADGRPVEEPPLPFDEWVAADSANQPFTQPPRTEHDRVLAECPVHFTPWTIKPGGVSAKTGQPYGAFFKCAEKNDDGSWCSKKPTKEWLRTHDAEKALAAA